jgi:hypothetical protein
MATIKFQQTSKNAAQSKMRRLVGNSSYGTIGFCNFQLVKDYSSYVSDEEIEENPYCVDRYDHDNIFDFAIQASSTYHSEKTIQNMYKSNGKKW